MSLKNSNDAIENKTQVLPACSAVPQQAAPPRYPAVFVCLCIYRHSDNFVQVETCSKEINNKGLFIPNCAIFLSNTVP
jgi:hypothetical protein